MGQKENKEVEKMIDEVEKNIKADDTIEQKDNKDTTLNKDEYIAKLNDDLSEQKKKADEYFESLKRNMADFDNFKKRMSKEKDNLYSSVTSDMLENLLPILDNFDQAISAKSKDESFKNGMVMIYNQLKETLNKFGLEEIECLGKEFDPNLHEAVLHIEDEKYKEKEIIQVLRKGYKIADRVIRHAMVQVAN